MHKAEILELTQGEIGLRFEEARKVKRYRLAALAYFWWGLADGLLYHSRGTTRDISCKGVFVVTDYPPPVATSVELDVFLPIIGSRTNGIRLRGKGQVLRVESRVERGFSADVLFEADTSLQELLLGPAETQ